MPQERDLWPVKTDLAEADLLCSAAFPAGTPGGKLGGRGYGFQTPSGEHLAKQVHDLLVQKAIRSKHLAAVEAERAAVKAAYRPSGFRNQECAGGRIPCIQVEFPVAVKSATGGVSQIKRSGPCPPHSMRPQRDLLVEVDIWIFMSFAAGKPRSQQSLREIGNIGGADPASVQEGALTLFRRQTTHRASGRRSPRQQSRHLHLQPDPAPCVLNPC